MAKENKVFKTMVVELPHNSYVALKQEQLKKLNETGKLIPLNKLASAYLILGIKNELNK